MKKFITNIANRVAAWGSNSQFAQKGSHDTVVSNSDIDGVVVPLNISIYRANGGKVIKTITYDQHTGNHKGGLYIVHDGDDIGEQLSMIITKEYMS